MTIDTTLGTNIFSRSGRSVVPVIRSNMSPSRRFNGKSRAGRENRNPAEKAALVDRRRRESADNSPRAGINPDGRGFEGVCSRNDTMTPPATVLIVDDEPLVRWSVGETLNDSGYRVTSAADA